MKISFSRGIVSEVWDTERWPLERQIPQRCLNLSQDAKVLDGYTVIGECKFDGSEYRYVARSDSDN